MAQLGTPMAQLGRERLHMARLRGLEDTDSGLSSVLGSVLTRADPSGSVRRRLWTRADFMHVHAVSGAYFLGAGLLWLLYSHIMGALEPEVGMSTRSPFLRSLLVAGLINALSAIPMARFSSDRIFDLRDLKANGFTFGGSGLTCMCLWLTWWFSGEYPAALHVADWGFFSLWALICVGSTLNWEARLTPICLVHVSRTSHSDISRIDHVRHSPFTSHTPFTPYSMHLLVST